MARIEFRTSTRFKEQAIKKAGGKGQLSRYMKNLVKNDIENDCNSINSEKDTITQP